MSIHSLLSRNNNEQYMTAEIQKLIKDFRDAAIEKDIFAEGKRDGQLYEIMRNSFHQLKAQGKPGQEALESLLDDESVFVRSWIAGALMIEGNEKARQVVEEISKISGIVGFNSKIFLQEFDAGRLDKPFPPSK
jgi:hypothetical protein